MPQRHERIEVCGSPGGQPSREQADGGENQRGDGEDGWIGRCQPEEYRARKSGQRQGRGASDRDAQHEHQRDVPNSFVLRVT